jgi:hypothetical protein
MGSGLARRESGPSEVAGRSGPDEPTNLENLGIPSG